MITVAVYGVVALIVKADDVGVRLALRGGPIAGPAGKALVHGMPYFLEVLSFIGMLAMLWVGGGILVHGLAEYGVTALEHPIHVASEVARGALPLIGGLLAWLVAATAAAVIGLAAGALTGLAVSAVSAPFKKGEK
jgi:predicted DNA repair protein MutK